MLLRVLFFLFVSVSVGICNDLKGTAGNNILDYLNSNSEQIYRYKNIKSLDILDKNGDTFDIKTIIEVECLQDVDSPCLTKTFSCEGKLQYKSESSSFDVASVFCNPEDVVGLESEDETVDTTDVFANESDVEKSAVSTEATLKFCLGCPVDLNLNVEGLPVLVNGALQHVESERDKIQTLVEVIGIQRQIVAGVKYILTLKIASTVCSKDALEISESKCPVMPDNPIEYCKVEFFEQPWISKDKNIISNNCTKTQYFTVTKQLDINVIDKKGEDNMTPERLDTMESQIITSNDIIDYDVKRKTKPESPVEVGKAEANGRLSDNDKSFLDKFFNNFELLSSSPKPVEERSNVESSKIKTSDQPPVSESSESNSSEELGQKQSSSSEEDNNERHKRDTSSKTSEETTEKAGKLAQSSESSSDTSEDSKHNENKHNKRNKRSVDLVRDKRSSSSSSSSSSNSSDDENKKKSEQRKNNDNNCDDSSSSSSSSSSEEDDNCKNKNKHKRSTDLTETQEKNLVNNLAEIVVATLDDIDDDGLRRVVLDVTNYEKTLLEGTIYNLQIKTALSNCKETSSHDLTRKDLLKHHKNKQDDCLKNLRENTVKNCRAQVHVSESYTSPKVLKSGCSRIKREVLVGGQTNAMVNDPTIVELAHSTLTLYDGTSQHDNKYKVVEITSATKQVVSGVKYRITLTATLSDCPKTDTKPAKDCGALQGSKVERCEVIIWDQPWLPQGRKTSISCDGGETKRFRTKRSAVLVGGVSPVPVDDPTIQELTEHTLKQLDGESSLNEKYKVTEIVSATQQVVAGILYTIEIKIVPSDCLKTETKAREECGIGKESEPQSCSVRIWDRPWLPNGRETNVTCDQATYTYRSKRSVGRIYGKDDFDVQLSVFRDFKEKYEKYYGGWREEARRFRIFRKNLGKIEELNLSEKGTAVYGITKFADLTYSEFKRKHMGLRRDLHHENEIPMAEAEIPDIELPNEFDWRKQNTVTEVKDQKACGSCWAFSVTGNIEGQYAIKHKKLLEFSEQELVDCDTYDAGCNGGLMDNAYRSIEQMGGLEQEKDYPYDAEDETCHFNKSLASVQVSGAVNISQNEDDMAKWLVQNGPISIAINANAMQFYVGGVSHPLKFLCNPKELDHGVLIVGYGQHTYPLFKKTLPFWIVKNSWGKSWGEQGYYRVYRGDGTCGLNETPSSAVVV